MSALRLGAFAVLATVTLVGLGAEPPPAPPPTRDHLPRWTPHGVVEGAVISQQYGCTDFELEPYEPACPTRHFHTGIDLAAPAGVAVHAAGSGVVRVGSDPAGYGINVLIDHGGGMSTLYAHLGATDVASGAAVQEGERLGTVGSTGLSTGPHLHFEVRVRGRPVDPYGYLVNLPFRSR